MVSLFTFLKLIMKVPRRYSTILIHRFSDIKLIEDYTLETRNKYINKLSDSENDLIKSLVIYKIIST